MSMFFALETQEAGNLCIQGRPVDGYARYIRLIDVFLSTNNFTSSAIVGGYKLTWIFANALNALTACIAHEEIPDVAPLVAALTRAVTACSACKPKMFDGLVISYFGLGMYTWLARDRAKAADYYVSGIAAAEAAVAARVQLCEYAISKAKGCSGNLAVLRGEVRKKPLPIRDALREFDADVEGILAGRLELTKIAKSLCGEPSCSKDMAALKCGRCLTERYCNTTCQRANWAAHKKVCKPADLG